MGIVNTLGHRYRSVREARADTSGEHVLRWWRRGLRVERERTQREVDLLVQQRVASLRAAQRRDLYGGIRYGCRVGQARRAA